jgi:hypothetical protein
MKALLVERDTKQVMDGNVKRKNVQAHLWGRNK